MKDMDNVNNSTKGSSINVKDLLKSLKSNRSPSTQNNVFFSKKTVTRPTYKAIIRVTPNNIFCTLVRFNKINKIVCRTSAGILKVAVSKKKLKFSYKVILTKFVAQTSKVLFNLDNTIILKVIGPIKVRKGVLLHFASCLKQKRPFIIETKPLKCFNGCRPKKQKRKKQKNSRILK